jgi:hypothetical protein
MVHSMCKRGRMASRLAKIGGEDQELEVLSPAYGKEIGEDRIGRSSSERSFCGEKSAARSMGPLGEDKNIDDVL